MILFYMTRIQRHTTAMSLGHTPDHEDLFHSTRTACEGLPANSIFRLLARDSGILFPDDAFADIFAEIGRDSIPPRIVAVVMVLQRFHGMSDREAVDAFAFDLRWKYAAGSLAFDYPSFAHTVLVDMRARLRRSERPDRIFEAVLDVAEEAGLVGRKRVLDSTALYDAVATQDTVTLVRSAIRVLLKASDSTLKTEIRSVLKRDDDYIKAGKPVCDWDDKAEREALVDALARDGLAALSLLEGRDIPQRVLQATKLLATVIGQDLEETTDGRFRIARGVARDRVISTVDPEARHGHKTSARSFDGYKGHIAIDPDSEIITATEVTPGNVADGAAAEALIGAELDAIKNAKPVENAEDDEIGDDSESDKPAENAEDDETGDDNESAKPAENAKEKARFEVYGDASYGVANLVERIESAGAEALVKVQPASPPRKGLFSQDEFRIDISSGTASCPNRVEVKLRMRPDGSAVADFGRSGACAGCPLRQQCTKSRLGRTLRIHAKHETLVRYRKLQRDKNWKARYRATRPKVERKIGHLMRRRHGGRRARVRGRERVGQDFSLLAAAVNLARMAILGVRCCEATC